jgi:hypothetical protein
VTSWRPASQVDHHAVHFVFVQLSFLMWLVLSHDHPRLVVINRRRRSLCQKAKSNQKRNVKSRDSHEAYDIARPPIEACYHNSPMEFRKSALLVLFVPVVLAAQPAAAPLTDTAASQLAYTLAHYTKYEYRIPMRDGVRLFAAVYVPKDTPRSLPHHHAAHALQRRTRTAPTTTRPKSAHPSPPKKRASSSSMRMCAAATCLRACSWTCARTRRITTAPSDTDESTDTYDTVDWLVKHVPNNNGKVGMWGISYPGFFAAHGLMDSHPALKAVSPQAPMGDVGNGDDGYHNGAFHLAANFRFYSGFLPRKAEPERPQATVPFDPGTMDAYEFFLRMGPAVECQREVPQTPEHLLGRHHPAHLLRRVLANPRPGAAHEERHARR